MRALARHDRRWLIVAAVVLQLGLLGAVSASRLSPRLFGDEVPVFVRAVDPVDPFRGRYVHLDYRIAHGELPSDARVWVELAPRRGGRLRLEGVSRTRPSGRAVRCQARDGALHCGIESFFASESEARSLDAALRERGAIARLRVDGAGRAAIVGLDPR